MTLSEAWRGGFQWSEVVGDVLAQVGGAMLGVAAAHLMFEEPLYPCHATSARDPASS